MFFSPSLWAFLLKRSLISLPVLVPTLPRLYFPIEGFIFKVLSHHFLVNDKVKI